MEGILARKKVRNHSPLIGYMPMGQYMCVGVTGPPRCLLIYTVLLLVNSVTRELKTSVLWVKQVPNDRKPKEILLQMGNLSWVCPQYL